MRIAVISLIVFINFILQSTIYEYIEIRDIKPNVAILIIITYAMLRGDVEGAILGFFAGLLQDMYTGRVIGMHAFLGTLTGYFCGKPFKDFYLENYMLPLLLTIVVTFLYEIIFYFMSFLFLGRIELAHFLRKIIIPTTIYTAVLSVPLYRMMYSINSRLETHENLRRNRF